MKKRRLIGKRIFVLLAHDKERMSAKGPGKIFRKRTRDNAEGRREIGREGWGGSEQRAWRGGREGRL